MFGVFCSPRTLEEAMEPKSFFPGPPEERDVPVVLDKEGKLEVPSTSKSSRERHHTGEQLVIGIITNFLCFVPLIKDLLTCRENKVLNFLRFVPLI